ncbi:aminopeptidase P family protein [Blautia sp. AF19-10LB]|uniref:aminopeptidase P family protein n=1 Tax=Blautia sp. AF19-10LB TaxID=2292961 RepID=UPI000E4EF1BD|nr:aminopeptidase P family protein [Blautia sp. AF19-10LB]RGG58343.1 aminopeptidase P family protein [Blautia sp. AF19-10LB]
MTIKQKLNALRILMKEKKIDAYLVATDDFHGSEYVGDYFKCRKYITGFTGSAGTAIITQDMAGLWTDGRYFIQAADQLRDTTIELFKSGEPGVPTVHQFLNDKLEEGMCLGFDGRTVSAREAEELQELLQKKHITFSVNDDLIGEIWEDRPVLSCEPVMELDIRWTGKSRADKIAEIREQMKAKEADTFILTSLDDIAWLLNIRGNDIHCCPVVLSYLVMMENELRLYANAAAFSEEIRSNLEADGVKIYPYDDVYSYVQSISSDKKVLLSRANVNSRLVSNIPSEVTILDEPNLTLLPKAVKNETEMENERIAHIKDGVAVTKFIHWLKKNVTRTTITELSTAEKLYQFRSEQEHFLGESFDPIIAYGTHAAIVHYSATEATDIPLEARGMVLADTGGHYLEGTTDITRTIVLGPVTAKEKKFFTAVLRGNLNLAAAKFKYGCTGLNLDYLARGPLWELGEDYNHGTGHGVGYLLNVHEGPNSFRWKNLPGNPAPVLEEGMITSDEPGYYLENEFGIRHENLVLCKKAEKTSFGQFMCFEPLTMVPFDLEGINPEEMTERERKLLNDYHQKVYTTISPYLDEEEKEWLKQATREI